MVRGARQAALGAASSRAARRPSSSGIYASGILDAVGGLDDLKENIYARHAHGRGTLPGLLPKGKAAAPAAHAEPGVVTSQPAAQAASAAARAQSAGSSLGVVDSQRARSAGSSRTLQWRGTGSGYSGTVSFGDRRHGL